MNDRNTLVMIDLITSTHPDRDYLDDHGQPQRCTDCNELVYWTDLRGWTHHRKNHLCWLSRREQ
jgi:hypothetical protein